MKTKIKITLLITLFAAISACGSGDNSGSTSTKTQGQGNVKFSIDINMTWSASTHPTNFPNGSHFTEFIGALHNNNVTYWKLGTLASTGIELMAERGDISDLSNTINNDISNGVSITRVVMNNITPSPGTSIGSIAVSDSHTLFSLVSMQAPSPDWFVGINSFELKPNGVWLDKVVIDLYLYDSGTDDGQNYTSPDADSNPPQVITKLEVAPFLINGKVIPLGTITIQRM